MKEFFNDVFYVPISEGGIHYLLNKLAKKAEPAYEIIGNSYIYSAKNKTSIQICGVPCKILYKSFRWNGIVLSVGTSAALPLILIRLP